MSEDDMGANKEAHRLEFAQEQAVRDQQIKQLHDEELIDFVRGVIPQLETLVTRLERFVDNPTDIEGLAAAEKAHGEHMQDVADELAAPHEQEETGEPDGGG